MILYIVKWTIIYSVLIILLHNLYLFFQNNLTTTKIKDYYNTFSIETAKLNIKNNTNNSNNTNNTNNTNNSNNISFLDNLQIKSTKLDDLNYQFDVNKFNIDQFNKDFKNEFNNEFNNNDEFNNTMKSELNDFLSKLNYD